MIHFNLEIALCRQNNAEIEVEEEIDCEEGSEGRL